MASPSSTVLEKGLNAVWLAQSRFRRRRFDECIEICTQILERNPYDQAVWYLKCRALTLKNWIDDTEIEEQVRGGLTRAADSGVRGACYCRLI